MIIGAVSVAALVLGGTATAGAAAAPGHDTIHRTVPVQSSTFTMRSVRVPLSSLPAQTRALLARSGSTNAATTAYEIRNYADGLCLDANDAGSTAGTNGDKVELWTCNGTDNQYWIPYDAEVNGTTWTILINDQYQSKCLNAVDAGGLANGRHAQLWDCSVNTYNEFWYWDLTSTSASSATYLFVERPSTTSPYFVLDATAQHLGDGDQVQIWTPNTGNQQLWYL